MTPPTEPTYIVSGYMRTGTSPMMRCLQAGGIKPVWREDREDFRRQYVSSGYDPNVGGLFEMGLCPACMPLAYFVGARPEPREGCVGFGCSLHFLLHPDEYAGRAIKVLVNTPGRLLQHALPVGPEYRVIIMRRHPEEIRQSLEGFMLRQAPVLARNPDLYHRHFDRVFRRFPGRKLLVSFRWVVEHQHTFFRHLRDIGWAPRLDWRAAAAEIDPEQYRYRIENLALGVAV